MSRPRCLFVTGATGALGKRFLRERLETTDDEVILLVRPKGRLTAEARARKILAAAGLEGPAAGRVEVVEGDVTEPGLGLGAADLGALRRADEFHHIAALTDLSGDEEKFRRANVDGTAEALRLAGDLCANGRLGRFFYFSTAYVPGSRRPYHATEDELAPDPAPVNAYEASKHAAEGLVRAAMAEGLPATIFRPSIVVGDSRTGEATDFNVLYPLMRVFVHGLLGVLPARPEATMNLVPVDFVIRAAEAIGRRADSVGRTYHLVTEGPPSLETLLRVKDVEFPTMPRIEFLDPALLAAGGGAPDPALLEGYRMIEPYLCYLDNPLTFDATNTRQALEGTGVAMPLTDYHFLARILRYAVDRGYLLA